LPETDKPPPSAKDLVGTWSRIGVAGLIRFRADGEFRVARNERDLRHAPFASGTYELEGRTITFLDSTGVSVRGVWKAGLADEELHAVVVEDGLGLIAGSEVTFVRI
jgi:hypothetical protein